MQEHEYFLNLYQQSKNNVEFINYVESNTTQINRQDTSILKYDVVNKDIVIKTDFDELISKIKNNTLHTLRLGCVEASFYLMYKMGKRIPLDHLNYDDSIDGRMQQNAGLYYKDESDKHKVIEWYCDNLSELAKTATITSVISSIKYDLFFYAYMNITHKTLHNWGLLPNVLITNLQGKKVLVVSNATDILKKSYDRGLQNVYNIDICQFEKVSYVKTPQTTRGSDYPHQNSIETTKHIFEQIEKQDYDIVLLACGVYGVPLTNLIHKKGKMAVYLGSALYPMFGVYSHGIPLPPKAMYPIYNTANFIEVEEQCPEHCKHIDFGKYWKI
jgi:hypothetical protein